MLCSCYAIVFLNAPSEKFPTHEQHVFANVQFLPNCFFNENLKMYSKIGTQKSSYRQNLHPG